MNSFVHALASGNQEANRRSPLCAMD